MPPGTSASTWASGVPFPPLSERYERLEETIQICFQMWSDDDGPYEGAHYRLAETLCSPPPVSAPRPRLLIGGGGERKTLRLVARYADACNFIGDAATVAHKVEVLRTALRDRRAGPGDDRGDRAHHGPEDAEPDAILREAEALRSAGADAIVVRSTGPEPARWLGDDLGTSPAPTAAIGSEFFRRVIVQSLGR